MYDELLINDLAEKGAEEALAAAFKAIGEAPPSLRALVLIETFARLQASLARIFAGYPITTDKFFEAVDKDLHRKSSI